MFLDSNKNTNKQKQNEITNNIKMVVKQKKNKAKINNEWPIKGRKIFLSRVGRQRKKKKYQFMGEFPSEIYPDYYDSLNYLIL